MTSPDNRKDLTSQIIRNAQPETDDILQWARDIREVLSIRDLEIHQRYLSSALDDAMENTLNTTAEIGTIEHELELSKTAEIANHLAVVEAALGLHG